MSKKTKKEKIIAAYRKKLRLLEQSKNSVIEQEIIEPPHKEIPKKISEPLKTKIKKTENEENITTKKYFFSDMKKSLILILIFIALEIGLYFAKLIK